MTFREQLDWCAFLSCGLLTLVFGPLVIGYIRGSRQGRNDNTKK